MEVTLEQDPAAVEIAPEAPLAADLKTEETDPGSNLVNYQTGPLFRYDPKFKHARGSFLKIKPDGTVTYRNPACITYTAPGSKPFKMTALKGRADGPVKTFARIQESIDKRIPINRYGKKDYVDFVGRPAGADYEVVLTDGHTALLKPGQGAGDSLHILDRHKDKARHVATLNDPEFHLALGRGLIMAEAKTSLIVITGKPGSLKISSSHESPSDQIQGNDAGSFEETLEVDGAETWKSAFNGRYLEPVCGTWPLKVWWISPEHQVVFEPLDGAWRYVVMPLRHNFTAAELE